MYRTILIDPPWPERGAGRVKRGADRHYETMNVSDIAKTIWLCPKFLPNNDCHLWLWSTNNYLEHGLALMRDLGFRYVTNTVWVKVRQHKSGQKWIAECDLQIGLGQYQRGAHELLLFGTSGKAHVPATRDRLPSVVFAPRTKHSQKPDVFYERIERVSAGPRLEMFARRRRDGWDSWGDGLNKEGE